MARDETSSLDRSEANRKQRNQHSHVHEEASGQSNLDNQRKPITAESQNVPPIPPRECSGQLRQTQDSNTFTRSKDGSDDTSLYKGIDDDIKIMTQEVHEQVNRDPSLDMTMVHKPVDPNLVCPICGKIFSYWRNTEV